MEKAALHVTLWPSTFNFFQAQENDGEYTDKTKDVDEYAGLQPVQDLL